LYAGNSEDHLSALFRISNTGVIVSNSTCLPFQIPRVFIDSLHLDVGQLGIYVTVGE